ncbi:hypothetical protein BH09PSE6_BH09PSE6_19050 [soil metagenome]
MTTIHHSRGRTLIELLISMTIGLIITAFVAGIFLTSTQTSRVVNQLGSIEDSGRTVMALIGNNIKQAGYAEIFGSDLALGSADTSILYHSQTLFGVNKNLGGCISTAPTTNARFESTGGYPAGKVDAACIGAAADTVSAGNPVTGNDALMVRFQGNTALAAEQGQLFDCLHAEVPLELDSNSGLLRPVVQNTYYVDNGNLMCRGNGNGQTALETRNAAAWNAPQALINNVEQFKVYYGFDDVRYADTYVNKAVLHQPTVRSMRDAGYLNGLSALTAEGLSPWDYVVSVYVCFVVRSDRGEGGLTAETAGSYLPCPANSAAAAAPLVAQSTTDGVLRRTYTQVFNVRARSSSDPSTVFGGS